VVGVNEYRDAALPVLRFAEEDAEELATVLECANFEVVLLSGTAGKADPGRRPTRANIEKQLTAMLGKLAKGELLVVALAGHGLTFDGDGDAYFCPQDAAAGKEGRKTLLSIRKLYQQLGKAPGIKLVLADACRLQGLHGGSGPRPPAGVAALLSCSAGQRAIDFPSMNHGLFFFHVIEGLRGPASNPAGEVEWNGLSKYVRKWVAELAQDAEAKQTPALVSGGLGDDPVVLVRRSDSLASSAMLGIQYMDLGSAQPGQVLFVLPGSGAARMGLRKGDVIEEVNKRTVRAYGAKTAFAGYRLGERLRIVVTRDGRKQTLLGRYASPFSVERDLPRLLEQGERDPALASFLGGMYAAGFRVVKNEVEAVRWYRRAAEKGHAPAQASLGDMYRTGVGVAKDEAQAARWYRKAAEAGHSTAQATLGFLYRTGQGVEKDEAEALRWYRKAAEGGHAGSQALLGFMYANGRGLEKDEAQALRWYRKAVEQGNADGLNGLGLLHLEGRAGLEKDAARAAQLFRLAAKQNNPDAQYNLGLLYERGEGGLGASRAEAIRWYRLAAAQRHSLAGEALRRLKAAP
jgi:TPR repeat protein